MSRTGIRRINQKTKESHSMTGLLKIRKLLRSFYSLPVPSKVPRTTSRNSLEISRNITGSGRERSTMILSYSTRATHNLKILRRSLSFTLTMKRKLILLRASIKLVLYLLRLKTPRSVSRNGYLSGKRPIQEIFISKPKPCLKA